MLFIASLFAAASALTFTGDVQVDFFRQLDNDNEFSITRVRDPSRDKDVGMPNGLIREGLDTSGWDIESIYFQYDPSGDLLNIGIDCFVICGDADGDGDQGRTSEALRRLGGLDKGNLEGEESFAIQFDWTTGRGRGASHIMGIPSGELAALSNLQCSAFGMSDCFGLYTRINLSGVGPGFLFNERLPATAYQNLGAALTSQRQPDQEWRINGFSSLHPVVTPQNLFTAEFDFFIQAFAGSFVDAGIGEDFLPNNNDFEIVSFRCPARDACDVCGGNGLSCLDCCGVPNGACEYDACDVCDGDDSSCLDCCGRPNGSCEYDICDECNGDGTRCVDCCGIPNGVCEYDICDVCEGDGFSCLDCEWILECTSPIPHHFKREEESSNKVPMLSNGMEQPTKETGDALFKRADTNQDGQLSEEEFLHLMNL